MSYKLYDELHGSSVLDEDILISSNSYVEWEIPRGYYLSGIYSMLVAAVGEYYLGGASYEYFEDWDWSDCWVR